MLILNLKTLTQYQSLMFNNMQTQFVIFEQMRKNAQTQSNSLKKMVSQFQQSNNNQQHNFGQNINQIQNYLTTQTEN